MTVLKAWRCTVLKAWPEDIHMHSCLGMEQFKRSELEKLMLAQQAYSRLGRCQIIAQLHFSTVAPHMEGGMNKLVNLLRDGVAHTLKHNHVGRGCLFKLQGDSHAG